MSGVRELLSMCVDPRLDGAACKGQHELFEVGLDGELPTAVRQRSVKARAICARCPVLTACQTVADELPTRHRRGTWAGVTYDAAGKPIPRGDDEPAVRVDVRADSPGRQESPL